MTIYQIIRFPYFVEQFNQLDSANKGRIGKLTLQLSEKGSLVGKPLGFLFLREKKFNGNRLYFLVYEEWKAVLIVSIGDKRDQTKTIQEIKRELNNYKEYIYNQLKEQGLI